jgi:hypothetical protein
MRTALTICAVALLTLTALETSAASDQQSADRKHVETPYANMPKIAPIGVRIGQHLPIPESAKGAPIDPAKGYRLEVEAIRQIPSRSWWEAMSRVPGRTPTWIFRASS